MRKTEEADEANGLSYEEARKQRVEENKRRMLELGLKDLSASLRNDGAAKAVKGNRLLKRKAPSLEELGLEKRRSSRVAAGPAVDYKTQLDFDIPGLRARYSMRGNRTSLPRRITNAKARHEAIDAAELIEKDVTNPSFVKAMLHSHVSSCFWLGLPKRFCEDHLPKHDEKFMLEDEQEREWETIYLAQKTGLSGGWRGFSLDHDLRDGDACLFELVAPRRFKVHIVRVADQPSAELEVDEEEAPRPPPKNDGGKKAAKAQEKEKVKVKAAAKAPPKKQVKKEKEVDERYAAAASMVALRVRRGRGRGKENGVENGETNTAAIKKDDVIEVADSDEDGKTEADPGSEIEEDEDEDEDDEQEEESEDDDTWKPKKKARKSK